MTPRRKRTSEEQEGGIETFLGIVTTRVRKRLEEEKREEAQSIEEYLRRLGYAVIDRVGDHVVEVLDSSRTRHYLCIYSKDGKPCMFHTWNILDMARHMVATHDIVDKKLIKTIARKVKNRELDPEYVKKILSEIAIANILRDID